MRSRSAANACSGNHYSKMFDLKDPTTGENMFEQISITLVCGTSSSSLQPSPRTHRFTTHWTALCAQTSVY
jgi:hypothetical protein